MHQLILPTQKYWSVSEINGYLRDLLEGDPDLQEIWIQGEVSNISQPRSGHLYFTIKDSSSALRCVMWRNNLSQQTYIPVDGHAIEVFGSISVYEAQGQFQLYATIIRSAGEGVLYQEFLRLKTKLEREGLFASDRKRGIPELPKTIGVVTSPTGAALRDILNTLQRRFPIAEVVIAPTQVQGVNAPEQIVNAINYLNLYAKPDVILLARGGGSMEDLMAFNDERVARTIANSNAPIITGIGHETDFTIADFTADLRAPTPTAAAEMSTPNRESIISLLRNTSDDQIEIISNMINQMQQHLSTLEYILNTYSPNRWIPANRQKLDNIGRRIGFAFSQSQKLKRNHIENYLDRFVQLSPTAIMNRGYSIATNLKGEIIKSINQVEIGETLKTRITDGTFESQIKDLKSNDQ